MNLPEAQEAGILEARDQPQHPSLIAELDVVLKSHQVLRVGPQIFLPQLHDRVRRLAGFRIAQSHRLHGTEAQSVAAAPRNSSPGTTGPTPAGVPVKIRSPGPSR